MYFSLFADPLSSRTNTGSIRNYPHWTSRNNSLGLIGLSRLNKVNSVARRDNWGGANIHIFVFTHRKSNRFQKKLIT